MANVSYSNFSDLVLFSNTFIQGGFVFPTPSYSFNTVGSSVEYIRSTTTASTGYFNINPEVTVSGAGLSVNSAGLLSGTIQKMVFRSDDKGEIATISGLDIDGQDFTDILLDRINGDNLSGSKFEELLGVEIDIFEAGSSDDNISLRGFLEYLSEFDLGAGDDRVSVHSRDDFGIKLTGGSGMDTLVLTGGSGDESFELDIAKSVIRSDERELTFSGFERFETGPFVDRILGSNGADNIYAAGREDLIYGNGGNDYISAGFGDDRVFSGSGNDEVILGEGNDYVRVGGGEERFDGGAGKDYISYYDSTNGVTINLETNEVSRSWAVNDTILNFESVGGSSTGNDNITGTSGANTIRTYGGNDKVYAGKGSDIVELGSGDDYVRVGGGKESFDGGDGNDWISYFESSNGIIADLGKNEISGSWAVNDTIKDFESITGSGTGDDDIIGTTGSNTIRTYGGDDRVSTLGGTDVVELGSGNDYVRVGGGKESFDGGSGKDYISYYDSSNGIRIDLRDDEVSGSWAVNDTIKDFESASGSKTGNDTMLGTNGSNTLRGNGGDDKLYGRGGSDKMYGGDGEDFLDGGGGSGTDLLYGGDDADVFHFDRGEGVDVVKDFEDNVDVIELDGFVFPQEVGSDNPFDYATQVGDDVVFDFGSDGMLTVENATIGQLGNDLEVV